MAKVKSIFKKNIAIIVSLLLVLAIFMPILPQILKVEATVDAATKIEDLKAAWGAMTVKTPVETGKQPTYYKDASTYTDTTSTSSYIANGGSMTGITAADLGSIVGTYNVDASGSGEVFLSSYSGEGTFGVWSGSLRNNNYADMYLYYKVNSVEAGGSLKLHSYSHNGTGISQIASDYNKIQVTEADVQKGWQKISLDQFFKGTTAADWRTFFTGSAAIYTLSFKIADSLKANISFGSLVASNKATVPTDTAGWDIVKWYDEALKVDTTLYNNTTAFKEVLVDIKQNFPEVSITALKSAWSKMTIKVPVETGKQPTYYKDASTYTDTTSTSSYIANGGSMTGITAADLGSIVGTYNVDATGSTAGEVYVSSYSGEGTFGVWSGSLRNNNFADMYLYYKVNSVEAGGSLKLHSYAHNGTGIAQIASDYNKIQVTEADVQKGWQKISLDQFFKGTTAADWRTFFTGSAAIYTLSFKTMDSLKANISFGSLVATKKVELPTDTATWQLIDWYKAGIELDLSAYNNTEEFSEVLAQIKSEHPEFAVDSLKSAWSKMTIKVPVETGKQPTYYKDASTYTDTTSTSSYIANGGSMTGITAADLGSIVGTYNVDATGSTAGEVYVSSYSGEGTFGVWSGSLRNNNFADMYLYYKVNSVEAGGSLKLHSYSHNGTGISQIASDYNKIQVTEADVQKGWQKISLDQFFKGTTAADWRTFFTGSAAIYTLSFKTMDSLKANISFGSLVATKKVELPTDTATWQLIDWYKAGIALDLNDYENTEEFSAALAQIKEEHPEFAVDSLKNAWSKMTYKVPVETGKQPTYYKGTSTDTDTTLTSSYIATGGSMTGITAADLGSIVGTYNVDATGSTAGEVYLSSYSGEGTFSAWSGSLKTAGYADMYLYYKVNSVESEGSLQPNAYTHNGTTFAQLSSSSNKIEVTKADVQKGWQKISADQFFKGTNAAQWLTYFSLPTSSNPSIYTLSLKTTNGLKANITFGSLVAVKKAEVPTETTDWDISDWFNAADALLLSDYNNTDAFIKELQAIKSDNPELALISLKNAWARMNYKAPLTLLRPTFYLGDADLSGTDKNVKNLTSTAEAIANGLSIAGISELSLGSTVGTFDFDATGPNAKAYVAAYDGVSDPVRVGYGPKAFPVKNYDDMYLYYKVNSVSGAGSIQPVTYIKYINNNNEGVWTQLNAVKKIQVDETDALKGWQKISAKQLFGGTTANDWQNYFTNGNVIYDIALVGNDDLKANISIGSFVAVQKSNLPTNTEDWGVAEWLSAAAELNLDEYDNSEDFAAKLEDLKVANAEVWAKTMLKQAWSKMTSYTSTMLRPTVYVNKDTTAEQLLTGKAVPNTENLRELGDTIAAYDVIDTENRKTAGTVSDSVYFCMASEGNKWSLTSDVKVRVKNAEDLYFYYKVNDVTTSGKLGLRIQRGYRNEIVSTHTIDIKPESANNGWQKVSITQLVQGSSYADWKTSFNTNNSNLWRVEVAAMNGINANISFGSFVGRYTGKIPDNTDKWNIADWVYAAFAVDTTAYSDNAESVEAFNAALENAIRYRDDNGIERTAVIDTYSDAASIDMDSFGKNLLAGKKPEITYYNGTERLTIDKWTDAEKLNDTDLSTGAAKEEIALGENGSYLEFVYTFAGLAKIQKLLVAHSDNVALRNAHYKVSVAPQYSALFSKETIVADYDNADADFAQVFSGGEGPEIQGRFFGIRIYVPAANLADAANSVYLTELAAFGEESVLKRIDIGNYTNEGVAALGNNLIANDNVGVYVKNNDNATKQTWLSARSNYDYRKYVDQQLTTMCPINLGVTAPPSEVSTSYYLMYDLGAVYDISKVFVAGASTIGMEIGKYEIYANTNVNRVFTEASRVFSYDNTVEGPNTTSQAQLFTLEEGALRGRYIAIKFTYPVSDFERSFQRGSWACQVNLYELGFYGTPYTKPRAQVNLMAHVPGELYRTDAEGVHTKVDESEYSGTDHKLIYDGKYDAAKKVALNGQTLDYVFNLSNNMRIYDIQLTALTSNFENVKFYGALTEDGIWEEESLLHEYSGNAIKNIGKKYTDSPTVMRFFRVSVSDTVSGYSDVAEIEAIGWNDQEFEYINLLEERRELLSIVIEDKNEGYITVIKDEKFGKYRNDYPLKAAVDSDEHTVADIYLGKQFEETVSVVADLGALSAIDTIALQAGSSSEYWPDKLNIYIAESEDELYGESAVPIKKFTQKALDTDGLYSYEMLPKLARYIRFEYVESKHPQYYDKNIIQALIGNLSVNGLSVVGVINEDGAVASFIDEITGIRLDIMALDENDFFDTVREVEFTKLEPTDEQYKTLKEQGMIFASNIYEIVLLDASGNQVTDVGGREVRVSVPKALYAGTEDAYILLGALDGSVNLVESSITDTHYVLTLESLEFIQIALGVFGEFPDEVIENQGDNDDTPEEIYEDKEEEEQNDNEGGTKKRRKKIRIIKTIGTDYTMWIIIGAAAVVVITGALLWYFLYFRKKRKAKAAESTEIQE